MADFASRSKLSVRLNANLTRSAQERREMRTEVREMPVRSRVAVRLAGAAVIGLAALSGGAIGD